MRRFILTGAPGSGKTSILRQLELDGFSVVDEAATDVIAAARTHGIDEPWRQSQFIDQIATLQRDRQLRAACRPDEIQFHDRSAIGTAALARYLGYPLSPFLAGEIDRIQKQSTFQNHVFFIRNLGSITNTDARRITFEETLRFEKIHEDAYRQHGFELLFIEPASVLDRVSKVKSLTTDH